MATTLVYSPLDDVDRNHFDHVLADDIERVAFINFIHHVETKTKKQHRPKTGRGRVKSWGSKRRYWINRTQEQGQLPVVEHPVGGPVAPPPPSVTPSATVLTIQNPVTSIDIAPVPPQPANLGLYTQVTTIETMPLPVAIPNITLQGIVASPMVVAPVEPMQGFPLASQTSVATVTTASIGLPNASAAGNDGSPKRKLSGSFLEEEESSEDLERPTKRQSSSTPNGRSTPHTPRQQGPLQLRDPHNTSWQLSQVNVDSEEFQQALRDQYPATPDGRVYNTDDTFLGARTDESQNIAQSHDQIVQQDASGTWQFEKMAELGGLEEEADVDNEHFLFAKTDEHGNILERVLQNGWTRFSTITRYEPSPDPDRADFEPQPSPR